MTKRMRLTDAGIMCLKPGIADYTVWDTVTPGLGLRVRTSRFRGFVFHQRGPGSARRMSLGPVTLKCVGDARKECLSIQLDGNADNAEAAPALRASIPLFRDYVADPWLAGIRDSWKPSTLRGVQSHLRSKLLPAFGDLPLDRITPAAVEDWFDRCSVTAPGAANAALSLLRQIMNHACASGLVATNPARRARKNPRPRLTRFLSADEIVRLHEELDRCVDERPAWEAQADIILLLLYTGTRKSEIKNLRWTEVDGDALRLADSKTGPRTVHLSADARAVIDRQRRGVGPFVFPSPVNPGRLRGNELKLWSLVRERAGLSGVRLHDCRHTYASQAVMKGVPLSVVARLLDHRQLQVTMRYAHVGDREVIEAAERIGEAISRALDGLG